MTTVESAKDRRALVNDAGYQTVSGVSVVAGTLVAFGFVAVVMAVVGAIGSELGIRSEDLSTGDWRRAGAGAAFAAVVVLAGAFGFGGYTAGRMARRAGARQGLAVFILATAVIGFVILLAATWGDPSGVTDELSSRGVPTDLDTWDDIGLVAIIAAGIAMFVGALAGGIRGDRWHGRLVESADIRHRIESESDTRRREAHEADERRARSADDWSTPAEPEHAEPAPAEAHVADRDETQDGKFEPETKQYTSH